MLEDGVPIGYGEIEVIGDEVWLNNFAIREDYRGLGYGQQMLKMLIDKYGVNTLTCAVENERAYHIYKKHGFRVVSEWSSFDHNNCWKMQRGNI